MKKLLRRGALGRTLLACLVLSPAAVYADALENGVTRTNLASTSNPIRFTLDVPANASDLSFTMSGGSGDADLYVRYGSEPTTSSYDCRPYASGNNENCPFATPQAGTYHVMLNPYSAFSGVSLLASFSEGDPGGPGDGQLNEPNLSGGSGSTQYFSLEVPAGATNLSFAISGGSGDADLYVRYGSQPTTSAYDCRPYIGGNNETCPIDPAQAGTYYVMLRGYSAYSGVTLTGTYDGGSGNQSPQAVIANGPYSALEGVSISMSSQGSSDPDGTISSYSWDFGDGSTSTSASPTHSYSNAGTYTITLTVTDNGGATATASTTATISSPANQPPSAVIGNGPYSASTGQTISLSSAGSFDPDGTINSYQWNFGDGTGSTQANPSHSYVSAGNYTISLTVTDDEGATDSVTTTAFISEVANQSPQAVIANGPFAAQVGESVSMSSTGSTDPDGTISAYQWSFGDGNSSTAANPNHVYTSPGSYQVMLTVTDDDGASSSATSTATINDDSSGDELNESGLAGSSGSNQYFSLVVPAGATNLVFQISGGSGDADLYVRFGSQPTTSAYDCRPYVGGNNETCSISNVQAGTYYVMIRAYSAYSGVTLTGTYEGSTGGNTPPVAVIANGPFSAVTGTLIPMSSNGSGDSDGSLESYAWDFGDGSGSTAANPSHSYTAAGTYTVSLTVTDNEGASDTVTTTASISIPQSGFTATAHYYDKGQFDHLYSDYDSAFSDNYSDTDVEIHAWIVIDFNENVLASSIVPANITVKRLNMADTAENNQNRIDGEFVLTGPRQAVFKPHVKYYVNEGGTFDWNNPNWNGLKPNYSYSVTLSSAIRNSSGEPLEQNDQSAWTFETIDNDYGLYWFKNGTTAMKYVPGREMPLEYYDPSKPTHIYAHGWAKTSVHEQEGSLRDYRREPMTVKPGSMYPAQDTVDIVEIWKDPDKNHEGKAWNFGIVYWNQFADDDYAYLSKPQMAEAKIWSTDGKNDMSYAIRNWNGSSWSQDHVETHAPLRPVSVILADAMISSMGDRTNGELRLSGNSLGNQVVTAISYVLKKEYVEGRVSANLFPKRLALLDPYWRGGSLQDNWTTNHPAYVDLGSSSDSAGSMSVKIVTDLIDYADSDPAVSFVLEYYDTSRTTDGSFLGQSFGDRNSAERDIAAIVYQQASWIDGNESDRNFYAHRHVFGRYWYPWQYAFPPPANGISASSSDEDVRAAMNYYKSTKVRYSISAGGDPPSPEDDNYSLISGSSWQQ